MITFTKNNFYMNKEFRLNLYLAYAHALSDTAHIIFGLTLYFVSDNLNISILTMGFIYNLASIFRGLSGVSAGILSDKSNFSYWIILFAALSTLGCLVLSISNNTNNRRLFQTKKKNTNRRSFSIRTSETSKKGRRSKDRENRLH